MEYMETPLPTHSFVKEKSYKDLLLSHANLESLISPSSTTPTQNDNFVNEWASILSSKAKRDRYTSFLFSQIERIDNNDRDENTLNLILLTSKEFLQSQQKDIKEKYNKEKLKEEEREIEKAKENEVVGKVKNEKEIKTNNELSSSTIQISEKESNNLLTINPNLRSNKTEISSPSSTQFVSSQIKRGEEAVGNAELLLLSKLAVLELENVMNLILWYLDTLSTLIWYWKEQDDKSLFYKLQVDMLTSPSQYKNRQRKIDFCIDIIQHWKPKLGKIKNVLMNLDSLTKQEEVMNLILISMCVIEEVLEEEVLTSDIEAMVADNQLAISPRYVRKRKGKKDSAVMVKNLSGEVKENYKKEKCKVVEDKVEKRKDVDDKKIDDVDGKKTIKRERVSLDLDLDSFNEEGEDGIFLSSLPSTPMLNNYNMNNSSSSLENVETNGINLNENKTNDSAETKKNNLVIEIQQIDNNKKKSQERDKNHAVNLDFKGETNKKVKFVNNEKVSILGLEYSKLLQHLEVVVYKLSNQRTQWMNELKSKQITPVPFLKRHFLELVALGAAVSYLCFFLVSNSKLNGSDNLSRWYKSGRRNLAEWIYNHTVYPIKAIFGEIVNDKTLEVSDEAALKDSMVSLQKLLSDFYIKKHPTLSSEALNKMSGEMDVTLLSQSFEKEMQSPVYNLLIGGHMSEMIFIQMTFIKKELLTAMRAIDQLLKENHFSMKMMSTFPAIIGCFVMYVGSKWSYEKIYRRKEARAIVRRIRFTLSSIERLLMLSTAPQNEEEAHLLTGSSIQKLKEVDLGTLVLLLYRLERELSVGRYALMIEEKVRVEDDLKDLISDSLSIGQRLQTVQRMYRTYGFLQPIQRENYQDE